MLHYTIAISDTDGESFRALTTPSPKEALGLLRHCDHEGSMLSLVIHDIKANREFEIDSVELEQYQDSALIYDRLDDAITEVS